MKKKFLIVALLIITNVVLISDLLSVQKNEICTGFKPEITEFHDGFNVSYSINPGLISTFKYVMCCMSTNNHSTACDFSLENSACKLYFSRNLDHCGTFVPNN
jgi:hypothetical protein